MSPKTIAAALLAFAAAAAVSQPAGAATYVGAGAGISDFVTTLSTITVDDSFAVQSVALDLETIYHSYASDVELSLEHGGQIVKLFNHKGAPYGPFAGNLGFDDAASDSVGKFTAGGGEWRPFEMLSAFHGADAKGDWTLRAYDNAGGDQGSYAGWILKLAAPAAVGGVPEPQSWALMILGLAAIGAVLWRRSGGQDRLGSRRAFHAAAMSPTPVRR